MPSRIRADGLPESRVSLSTRGAESRCSVQDAELRVIKSVVEFPPERQHSLFAAQIEVPEQRKVEVGSSGAAQDLSPRVSERSARVLNARCIEPVGGGAVVVTV